MDSRIKFTPEAREIFLEALRRVPNVTDAAEKINMRRDSMYRVRDKDAEFAEEWDNAIKEGVDRMERELHRRAFEGIDKPITHLGRITDTYKEFSDSLAVFLMKAHNPERFRDRSTIDHNITDVTQTILDARKRAGK